MDIEYILYIISKKKKHRMLKYSIELQNIHAKSSSFHQNHEINDS